MKHQENNQSIDIAGWQSEQEFNPYPVGARDKSLVISPNKTECKFIAPNHRYLYKHSIKRYPEQFWMEVFCYRFGSLLNISVPPAFVAYDSDNGTCGALIEWFLKEDETKPRQIFSGKISQILDKFVIFSLLKKHLTFKRNSYIERYTPGGDFLQKLIPDYDRKRGEQHNYDITARLCKALLNEELPRHNWVKYWVITFIFDALVGNTDRHQDNWGIIWKIRDSKRIGAKLTPIFDNGTSMGHEIFEYNFVKFDNASHIEKYINRGSHHMKWKLSDKKKIPHLEIIPLMISKYPESRDWINEILNFSMNDVKNILNELCEFDIPIPLTESRANFMLKLVKTRKEALTSKLLES